MKPDTKPSTAAPGASKATPVVELQAADLNGSGSTSCPNPKMALWSAHPKVFIEVASHGQGRCPYCGTVYRLAPGVTATGH